jgi:hypothetical protein
VPVLGVAGYYETSDRSVERFKKIDERIFSTLDNLRALSFLH